MDSCLAPSELSHHERSATRDGTSLTWNISPAAGLRIGDLYGVAERFIKMFEDPESRPEPGASAYSVNPRDEWVLCCEWLQEEFM